MVQNCRAESALRAASALSWFGAQLLVHATVSGTSSVAKADEPASVVIVEGERSQPEAPSRAPSVSGSVAKGERLRAPGLGTADILRDEPGVQVVELGGLGSPATASLRGATAAQTPVYLGGVRINDEVGGAADLSSIPLFMLERVEVYRSHAPIVGDRLGIGGAVFLEPRRVQGGQASLGGLVGSYGSRSVFAYAGAGTDQHGLVAGAELSAADNDYPFPSGNGTLFTRADDHSARLPNADMVSRSFWLHLSQKLGPAELRLFYHHADRNQGAPKLALTPSERARSSLNRDLFALTSSIPLPSGGTLEWVSSAIQSSSSLDDPGSELNLASARVTTPGERVEQSVRSRQNHGAFRFLEQLTLSEERLRRFETSHAIESERLSAERREARAALATEVPILGPARGQAELAWAAYATKQSEAGRSSHQEPSGRIGLDLRGAGAEFYANAGLYQRAPTLSELYGASLVVRGNPHLSAERGTVLEAGARYQHLVGGRRLAYIDAAGFVRYAQDLVSYARTAQGYLFPENRARARLLGGEFVLGAAPLPWLESSVVTSLLDPRDRSPARLSVSSANDVLPFLSRITLTGTLTARLQVDSELLEAGTISAKFSYQSSRYADPAGLGVVPEQSSVDLEAAAFGVFSTLVVRLRCANLFDAQRFDIVGFPLPGRSVFLSLEAKL
jgi:iron complex outermembrane receptor protein